MFKIILTIVLFTFTSLVWATNYCDCNVFENDSLKPIKTGQINALKPGALFSFEQGKCFFVPGCNNNEQDTLSIMCRAYSSEFSYSSCNESDVNLTIMSAKNKIFVRCLCSSL